MGSWWRMKSVQGHKKAWATGGAGGRDEMVTCQEESRRVEWWLGIAVMKGLGVLRCVHVCVWIGFGKCMACWGVMPCLGVLCLSKFTFVQSAFSSYRPFVHHWKHVIWYVGFFRMGHYSNVRTFLEICLRTYKYPLKSDVTLLIRGSNTCDSCTFACRVFLLWARIWWIILRAGG